MSSLTGQHHPQLVLPHLFFSLYPGNCFLLIFLLPLNFSNKDSVLCPHLKPRIPEPAHIFIQVLIYHTPYQTFCTVYPFGLFLPSEYAISRSTIFPTGKYSPFLILNHMLLSTCWLSPSVSSKAALRLFLLLSGKGVNPTLSPCSIGAVAVTDDPCTFVLLHYLYIYTGLALVWGNLVCSAHDCCCGTSPFLPSLPPPHSFACTPPPPKHCFLLSLQATATAPLYPAHRAGTGCRHQHLLQRALPLLRPCNLVLSLLLILYGVGTSRQSPASPEAPIPHKKSQRRWGHPRNGVEGRESATSPLPEVAAWCHRYSVQRLGLHFCIPTLELAIK